MHSPSCYEALPTCPDSHWKVPSRNREQSPFTYLWCPGAHGVFPVQSLGAGQGLKERHTRPASSSAPWLLRFLTSISNFIFRNLKPVRMQLSLEFRFSPQVRGCLKGRSCAGRLLSLLLGTPWCSQMVANYTLLRAYNSGLYTNKLHHITNTRSSWFYNSS